MHFGYSLEHMSRPWIPYVQLGIVHFMVYPEMMGGEGAIAETAAVLLSDGFFEVLEVGPVNEAGERARLREVVKSRHATLAFACQPILLSGKLNLNALGSAERARAVNAVRAAIQHARELGAVGLAVVSGSNPALADRHAATDALGTAWFRSAVKRGASRCTWRSLITMWTKSVSSGPPRLPWTWRAACARTLPILASCLISATCRSSMSARVKR